MCLFTEEITSRLVGFSHPTCGHEPPAWNWDRNQHYSPKCWLGGKRHCLMQCSLNAVHRDAALLFQCESKVHSAACYHMPLWSKVTQSQSIMLLWIRPIDPKMGASLFLFARRQKRLEHPTHTLLTLCIWKPRPHYHAACLRLCHFALPQNR